MAGGDIRADMWLTEVITPWDMYMHGATKVLAYRKTQFQEMYIIESGSFGKALMLDGKWQSSQHDEFLYHEGLVHPPLTLQGDPKKVLILGGAEGATIREVLRWKGIERVVMVDIDGEVVEACKELLPEMHQGAFDDPRVEVVIDDAQKYIESTTEKWDAVISDLSDPLESGPAFALFTQEHYQQVSEILAPGGMYMLHSGPLFGTELYMHARLANTVKSVFPSAYSAMCYATSYGLPLSYIIAANHEFSAFPDPAQSDRILAEKTTGDLRMMDGRTLLGMLQVPLHIRKLVEAETEIYTLKHPPKPVGRGSMDAGLND
ncbi:MAG: spermidine synthase [Thermosynechococcaceae cyanobacterium MS004]|nr:spermidine synthase [Thermosynechococcaceae cyanobacterium MS004]